jgi:hypothetical protein
VNGDEPKDDEAGLGGPGPANPSDDIAALQTALRYLETATGVLAEDDPAFAELLLAIERIAEMIARLEHNL